MLSFTFSPSRPCYLRFHQAIALPFFGIRWCLCTHKKRSVSSLGSCVCVLPSVFPFFLFFCRRLSPISYHRPLSVFPFRQLMENKITTIERGAFQDLKELERLWVTLCNQRQRDCESWNAVVCNADCQRPTVRSINPGIRHEGWRHAWHNGIPFEKETDVLPLVALQTHNGQSLYVKLHTSWRFWDWKHKKQHMYRLSLHNTLMRHKNTRQSNHKFRWRVRKRAVMLNWDPSDLRQKAQRGVSDDVVGPRPGKSDFWGIMEGTISTIINLACLLACPSHWLGVNNVFVIVTGVGRKDTV